MTSEALIESPEFSGEPSFLLTTTGEIRAANAAARALTGAEMPARLHHLVTDAAELVDQYLQASADSPYIMPGCLHFRPDGAPRPCAASCLPSNGSGEAVLLLRLPAPYEPSADAASQYLAAIVESSEDAIVGKTLTGTITSWNKAAERMFGYTAEEAIGQPITIIAPPQETRDMLGILDRIRRGERVEHYETVRRHKNGDLLQVALTVSPVRNGRGQIIGASKIARDISDRRRAETERADLLLREQEARTAAEEALRLHREVEQKLALLVQASGALLGSLRVDEVISQTLDLAQQLLRADAYAIWRCTPTARQWHIAGSVGLSEDYREHTVEGSELAAAPEAAVVFDDIETPEMISGRRSLYHAEGIRSLMAAPMRIHGHNSGTITFYYRQPHQFADPELRIATALANLSASAITTAELYRDQERMREDAEYANRRSTFLAGAAGVLGASLDYEITLDDVARLAVPAFADWCAVDILDLDGTLQRVALQHQDAEKTALARALLERYPVDLNRPQGLANVLRTGRSELYTDISDEMIQQAARDEEHLRLLRQIGIRSVMIVPMVARQKAIGAITFVAAESRRAYTAEDLAVAEQLGERGGLAVDNARLFAAAERERSEAQAAVAALRQSNAELEQFAYVSSHDLQEPLRTVSSYAQLLAQRYRGKLGPDADEFIAYLVDGAQRMSGLIEDLLQYSRLVRMGTAPFTNVNSGEALDMALMNLHKAIRDSGAQITREPLPIVSGHEIQISQVFQNLISNAIKYSGGRTPAIHISATRDGDEWRFAVADNGIGIDPQYRERIFGLFKRLHGRSVPGTGIGLATCKKIIEQHGGRIWVESVPKQGSTFYFRLKDAQ